MSNKNSILVVPLVAFLGIFILGSIIASQNNDHVKNFGRLIIGGIIFLVIVIGIVGSLKLRSSGGGG